MKLLSCVIVVASCCGAWKSPLVAGHIVAGFEIDRSTVSGPQPTSR